jgi:hypothetical protein
MCNNHDELDEAFKAAMDEEFDLGPCQCGDCAKSAHVGYTTLDKVAGVMFRLVANPVTWYVAGIIDAAIILLLIYALLQ